MKKVIFTVVLAVAALASSINVNAEEAKNDFVLNEIANELSFDNAYSYTLLCQRYITELKRIKESVRLTQAQKQARLENLKGIYADRFSLILDTWQTEVTLEELTAE